MPVMMIGRDSPLFRGQQIRHFSASECDNRIVVNKVSRKKQKDPVDEPPFDQKSIV